MVERGGLENRCGGNPTQGSNPCLSANKLTYFIDIFTVNSKSLYIRRGLATDFRAGLGMVTDTGPSVTGNPPRRPIFDRSEDGL